MKKYKNYISKFKSLSGKIAIVTGATGSIGEAICYHLLSLKCNIIMAVRNIDKGRDLRNKLLKEFHGTTIEIEEVDFSDFNSLKNFVERIKKREHIDFLINNAGVYHLPVSLDRNNIEKTFMTNYLSAFYINNELKDFIKRCNGKIINQLSASMYFYKFYDNFEDDIYSLKTRNKTLRYARSKMFLAMDSIRLKEMGYNITLCHPGCSATSLFNSSKGGFSKIFNIFIVPLMKIIFMNPYKASLSVIYSIFNETTMDEWISPNGLFMLWGYPTKKKIKSCFLNKKTIADLYNKSVSLIYKL